MVQKGAGRGRPRSFDEGEVLDSVRDAFWKQGYSATSMDQLAAAAGLHKPSLYGAFGDKKRLYLESLNRYLDEARRLFGGALARPKLADSLAELVDRAIEMFARDGGQGCFMMSTAIPEAVVDPEIGAAVRGAMDALDRALVNRFRRAIEEGELPGDADPEALAMVVAATHYDLSARARAGYSREQLRAFGDRALRFVVGGAVAARQDK